jgi:hypothetical protein
VDVGIEYIAPYIWLLFSMTTRMGIKIISYKKKQWKPPIKKEKKEGKPPHAKARGT